MSPVPRPRRENALLTLIRIPIFRRIWAVIAFSSLGDWLGLLANTALAQQLTHEQSVATQGAAISGVLLVRLAPDLLFGPFAAALADKFDRRKTVIIGEVAAGLLYASIAFGYNLVWLYIAQFFIEAAGLFTQPAKQVIWVAIVPKKLLATANQISLMSVYGTVPIASGIFALLSAANRLALGDIGNITADVDIAIVIALLLNTVTFLVSAGTVFISRHDIPVVPADREKAQPVFSLLREGVSFVRTNPLIRGLYVGVIGAFAAGGLTVGVAQLWVATLSAGTAGYSIMFGTVFSGLAVGMLVGPKVLPTYTRSRVFGLAIGAAGLTLLAMSLIRDFILADMLAALVGIFSGMAWIIGYTLIGHEVEDRLRGRTFAFVLSSVRLVLLLTIAVGPVLAGFIGPHSIAVGESSRLWFSGPGLTLLLGGLIALAVSYYASSRGAPTRTRLRDLIRQRLLRVGQRPPHEHRGLFVTVDGPDPVATARYTGLLVELIHEQGLCVVQTGEPTDTPIGRRVAELLAALEQPRPPETGAWQGPTAGPQAGTGPQSEPSTGLEPETAALLSAADRAEHVASTIRPALDRGAVVVCDRYLLTSVAVHGGGFGADLARIRSVNAWSTGELASDLTLVVPSRAIDETGAAADVGDEALRGVDAALREAADSDPDRCVRCPPGIPDALPDEVVARLRRLIELRHSQLDRLESSGSAVHPLA